MSAPDQEPKSPRWMFPFASLPPQAPPKVEAKYAREVTRPSMRWSATGSATKPPPTDPKYRREQTRQASSNGAAQQHQPKRSYQTKPPARERTVTDEMIDAIKKREATNPKPETTEEIIADILANMARRRRPGEWPSYGL